MPSSYLLRCCVWLCLVPLMAGCGVLPLTSTPAAESAAPLALASPAPSTASPAPSAQASARASAPPSAVASARASASASPAVSAAPSGANPGELERAYGPLVLLEAAAVAVEEAARQMSEGPEGTAFARMLAVSVLAGVANAALSEEAPIPEIEPVWQDARAVGQDLSGVVERWAGQQLTADQAAAELETLTPRIATILETAEAELAAEYNVDAAELERLRDETVAQIEGALASAIPQASTAP